MCVAMRVRAAFEMQSKFVSLLSAAASRRASAAHKMPDSSDSPSGNGDVSGRTNEGRKEGGRHEGKSGSHVRQRDDAGERASGGGGGETMRRER